MDGFQDGGTCLHSARDACLSRILEPFFLCVGSWDDTEPKLGSAMKQASAQHVTVEDTMIAPGLRWVKTSVQQTKIEKKKELTLYVCERHLVSDDSHGEKARYYK